MNKSLKFFIESKDELKKVVWPTKKQTLEMTVAVAIIVIVIGFYLGAVDYVLSKAMTFLLRK